jgi:hypothetical protein
VAKLGTCPQISLDQVIDLAERNTVLVRCRNSDFAKKDSK